MGLKSLKLEDVLLFVLLLHSNKTESSQKIISKEGGFVEIYVNTPLKNAKNETVLDCTKKLKQEKSKISVVLMLHMKLHQILKSLWIVLLLMSNKLVMKSFCGSNRILTLVSAICNSSNVI